MANPLKKPSRGFSRHSYRGSNEAYTRGLEDGRKVRFQIRQGRSWRRKCRLAERKRAGVPPAAGREFVSRSAARQKIKAATLVTAREELYKLCRLREQLSYDPVVAGRVGCSSGDVGVTEGIAGQCIGSGRFTGLQLISVRRAPGN